MIAFRLSIPQRIALGFIAAAVCLLLALMPGSPLPEDQRGFVAGMAAGMGVGLLVWIAIYFSPLGKNLRDCANDAVLASQARRYRRDFVPPMLAYVVVMLCWRSLLNHVDATWLRFVIALLPALLVALVIRAMARYVNNTDELQRRIELESIALSAALVGAGYMTLGFLQIAKLIAMPAEIAMLWVFPSLCMLYGLIKLAIARRYS